MKEKKHLPSWIITILLSMTLLIFTIALPDLLLQKLENKILSYRVLEKQEKLPNERMPLTLEQKAKLLLQPADKIKLTNGELYTKEDMLTYIKKEAVNMNLIPNQEMKGQFEAYPELYLSQLQSNVFWHWSYTDTTIKITGTIDEQSGKNLELSMTLTDQTIDLDPLKCAKDWGNYLNLSYKKTEKSTLTSVPDNTKQKENCFFYYNFPNKDTEAIYHLQLSEKNLSITLFNIVYY